MEFNMSEHVTQCFRYIDPVNPRSFGLLQDSFYFQNIEKIIGFK